MVGFIPPYSATPLPRNPEDVLAQPVTSVNLWTFVKIGVALWLLGFGLKKLRGR